MMAASRPSSGPDRQALSPAHCLFGRGTVTDGDGNPLSPGGPTLTAELLDRAAFHAGDRVVDVGCGQGRGTGLMVARGLRALGVDPDIIPLTMARRRIIGATFLRASGNALPFPDGSMDGILSECVLSIMPDRPKALTEWRRVLREGGRLAFSDVYARRHDGTGQTSPGEGVLLSADHLRHLVAEAGFTVTHFEDRSDLLRAWVGRFIFQYGSLDALWGDAATAKGLKALAPGYCMLIATKPVHGWSKPN